MISCNISNNPLSHKRIVEGYISSLNKADFKEISSYLNDSLRIEELEFLLSDNLEDYHTLFQWDSVFNAHYELIDIQELEMGMQVTLSKECKRILYLNDTALITWSKLEFSEGKITRIQTYEHLNLDFSKWESRRDTLVAWISVNHPELNGFEITQTIHGGQNYLKAIDLYTNRTQP
jgi:hypothetical protein